MIRNSCEFFRFIEPPMEESILIFHSCSSNLNVKKDINICNELHIGNTPRSIMTKGTSTRRKNRLDGYLYGNFDPGNQDKLMITYRRESSHDYTMDGACGVVYQGDMHFFGGYQFPKQHFMIEKRRSGKLVKLTKMKDLKIDLIYPSCSSFEISSEYFPWLSKNIVILCFAGGKEKSCFSFDDKLTYIGDSKFPHQFGGLTTYKGYLITVGGDETQKTELMERHKNGIFSWPENKSDFKFTEGSVIAGHSLVTIPSSHLNEEYVLLIGGSPDGFPDEFPFPIKKVFKFNGTWFVFGQLNKPRAAHSSIYWNDAVYTIGGIYRARYGASEEDGRTKIEIWSIKDSPDQFKTSENWPELDVWKKPHLFIVPDSFFPEN